MRLDRQLVHILVAAIALIVAYLVPSAAEAHAGHHHHAPAAVAAPAVALVEAQPTTTATAAEVGTQVSALGPGPSTPTRARACDGLCCGTSTACCVHALVAETGSAAPIRAATRLVRVSDLIFRPGVDPEALPKPPRTIA